MKKIINGLRYDTSKSITIGSYDNIGSGASSTSDFHYWEATLYKTPRSGKFFLAGEGGPMTRFARSIDQNSSGYGEDLIPMSREEALEWAERYLDADVIEEHFAEHIQDA